MRNSLEKEVVITSACFYYNQNKIMSFSVGVGLPDV